MTVTDEMWTELDALLSGGIAWDAAVPVPDEWFTGDAAVDAERAEQLAVDAALLARVCDESPYDGAAIERARAHEQRMRAFGEFMDAVAQAADDAEFEAECILDELDAEFPRAAGVTKPCQHPEHIVIGTKVYGREDGPVDDEWYRCDAVSMSDVRRHAA